MRAVVQRVSQAWVRTKERELGSISQGLVVLIGIGIDDTPDDALYLAEKIVNLRIFSDQEGKFNYSVKELQGEVLVVSQFTLFGDCRKGRRPSFPTAASPQVALSLYEEFLEVLSKGGLRIVTGEFQALMEVGIVNDGPVTILLDSKRKF